MVFWVPMSSSPPLHRINADQAEDYPAPQQLQQQDHHQQQHHHQQRPTTPNRAQRRRSGAPFLDALGARPPPPPPPGCRPTATLDRARDFATMHALPLPSPGADGGGELRIPSFFASAFLEHMASASLVLTPEQMAATATTPPLPRFVGSQRRVERWGANDVTARNRPDGGPESAAASTTHWLTLVRRRWPAFALGLVPCPDHRLAAWIDGFWHHDRHRHGHYLPTRAPLPPTTTASTPAMTTIKNAPTTQTAFPELC
ncbi:hypothetical protein DFJ73DRAFT_773720 [Zopfochytrium polystomum]|nr:hypothetical protein DFJ73DRAFT_773720 [Zopfochytrium polystomum]